MLRKPLDYDAYSVIERYAKATPDWDKLKNSTDDEFPVFIVGNMRQHRKHNDKLKGCNYYGRAMTFKPDFIMKRHWNSNGEVAEPCVFQLPLRDKALWKEYNHIFSDKHVKRIEGEVYGVPLRTLANIDLFEGNGEETIRTIEWVDFMEQKQPPKTCQAYMWVINNEFFLDNYTYGLTWYNCNTITRNNVDAYYFSG